MLHILVEIGEFMKKITIILSLLLLSTTISNTAGAQRLYKQKKYFGPIPANNLNINIGFIDGPSAEYLIDHLGEWAIQRGGEDYFDNISTAPFAQVGYERMITPFHFLKVNITYGYLKTTSLGYFVKQELEPPNTYLEIDRTFKVHYVSLDLGLAYYLIEPKVKALAPYVAGGFSAVFPMARLETDATTDDGSAYDLPGENIDQNTFESGLHMEFGMRYYLTNRYAAGLEGRYQMSQSKFKIHNGNFDLDYSGLSLSMNFYYFF